MDGVFENQVRVRAYEIWMALGQTHGQAHEHWITAERDLMAASVPEAKTRRAPAKAKGAKLETAKAQSEEATKAVSKKGKTGAKVAPPRSKVAKAVAPKKTASAKLARALDQGSNAASA